jgi:hypothetical protein
VCTSDPYLVTQADVDAGAVSSDAVAIGDLPGCTGSPGTSTCPVLTSAFASSFTPAVAATKSLASTGVAVSGWLVNGVSLLLAGTLALLLAHRRSRRIQ